MNENSNRYHIVLARDNETFERHIGSSNALWLAERIANKRIRYGNFDLARVYDLFGPNPHWPVFETRKVAQ